MQTNESTIGILKFTVLIQENLETLAVLNSVRLTALAKRVKAKVDITLFAHVL